ncbi:MAG: hypothetical protein P8M11_08560, partial [Planctomycetota bacterium]|nr:hypothetical protein [Planctomycetota bacterium]
MLFVFCDPKGKRLVELPLERMLTKPEWQTRPCLNCDCCEDVLHAFAVDPALSKNGCFVDLQAFGTNRPIAFFLPLGLPILDKGAFGCTVPATHPPPNRATAATHTVHARPSSEATARHGTTTPNGRPRLVAPHHESRGRAQAAVREQA